MALELADLRDGFPVSFPFTLANPAAAATTAMTTPVQAATGSVVPAGYTFYPMAIFNSANAALTGGSAIAKVTDDGTILAPAGPEVTLSLAGVTTRNAAVARRLASAGIAAGHAVGVKLVTDAGYLAVTVDFDCVVAGVLVPV